MTSDILWELTEEAFDPAKQHHKETIFTIGNGYFCTRGAFEEGYPGDRRASFVHGVFDAVPIAVSELANIPDWLPFNIYLNGERFSLDRGVILAYQRKLDLRSGLLSRTVRWQSPSGLTAMITLERFASLAAEHLGLIRCRVVPEFQGKVEFRCSLKGDMDNEGLAHWQWVMQQYQEEVVGMLNRTRSSGIELASAMIVRGVIGTCLDDVYCDVENAPMRSLSMAAEPGLPLVVDKFVAVVTSRDTPDVLAEAVRTVKSVIDWPSALEANRAAWAKEWERSDVVIEGDDEAQIAVRFNLFQMLIAAPRHDDRVNIGAKTLSGFGYRGHSFWDTEIFMLPLFTYTAPHIARNLLTYRYHHLEGARQKARSNGCEGAQYPWESADTGLEVTPTWVPNVADPKNMVRIWTGDIEIHISADVAYGAYQYWQVTGDDAWFIEKGAEIILDTAKFWASRAEWNPAKDRYEYTDVIGPDEYHEHVDNNYYTNRLAQWNLQTALEVLDWLKGHAPKRAAELAARLDLSAERLSQWKEVIAKIYLNIEPSGVVEQFEGYFQRKYVDLAAMEPRDRSVQVIFGIEGTNQTQVLKQPDVLMVFHVLRDYYTLEQVRVNYDYYTPRTDHSYGSSLGPSIQAIMACQVGKPDEAYEHFIRAARADLRDVRGNAGDGIHAASAGGMWQAVVFGFAGLRLSAQGWTVTPRLPKHWKRLAFKFFQHGQLQTVDIRNKRPIKGIIFDLDGVLTDTAEFHYRGWKRLADEEGLPFDREANEALRGVPRRESLLLILKDKPYPEEKLQEMMERKNRYYLEFIREIKPSDLLPGALRFLQELHQAGLKAAIGSASKNASEVIERLGIKDLFDAVSDGHSVERQKPAPDLFLHAAAQLGLDPAECVVVEDAAAGVAAAKAGGFYTVGLGPRERVGEADVVYPSLENVRLEQMLRDLA